MATTTFLTGSGTLQIKELATDMLRSWLDRIRVDKNYTESSAYSAKVHINIFFRDLVSRGVLSVSPIDGIHYEKRPVETMRKPIVLSEDYLRHLLAKPRNIVRAFSIPCF